MLCQAEDLVNRMINQSVTDEEWKVITIWIGGNDLCAMETCENTIEVTTQNFVQYIQDALDYLHDNVQNAFVNLVSVVDVSILTKGDLRWTERCDSLHEVVCSCAVSQPEKVTLAAKSINLALEELIASGRYDGQEFTVVLQPFFKNTDLPLLAPNVPDITYFAPDCFHFSQKGHMVAAIYLWNNMLEPVGSKTDMIDWQNIPELSCPSDEGYFYTNENSQSYDLQ